jgi:hypothetical protein
MVNSYYEDLYNKNKIKLQIINNGNLDEHSPRFLENISGLKIGLKTHQLAFLYAANKIENNTDPSYKSNIAIYGDMVGSGKSLAILSLIASTSNPASVTLPDEILMSNGRGIILYGNDCQHINTNIILVPHTIINQWEKYIMEYTSLSYIKVNTRKTSIFSTIDCETKSVLLVSNNFFGEFTDQLAQIYPNKSLVFSRMIIDEADNIKFSSRYNLKAKMTWFVTSSVENLFFPRGRYSIPDDWNNYTYSHKNYDVKGISYKNFIKSLFDEILDASVKSTKLLEKVCIKNSKEFVQSSFNLPEPIIIKHLCKTPVSIRMLQELNIGDLKDTLLTLINANDLASISERVGCNITNTKDLAENLCKNFTKSLENEQKHYEYINSLNIDAISKSERLSKSQKKIDEILDNIKYITDRITIKDDTLCPICYDVLGDPKCSSNCCYQLFCLECITNYFTSKTGKVGACPCCRKEIGFSGLSLIGDKNESTIVKQMVKKEYTKEEKFIDLISQDKTKKWLVFSEYDGSFGKLSNMLSKNNIAFSKINGSVGHIDNVISSFSKGDTPVLLLNAINFGMGLNLQMATDILIYHKLTPETEKQVIGRAQRPGRLTQLNIHYLCHSNEIMDKVCTLVV